jgi:hypothetical protein
LVSADISQPIQKIIGISWLTLADTINHIFGIGCSMSADTNSVSSIRGVLHRRETLIAVNFFCAVKLPNFSALYATASLDATSLGASIASLDATLSPSPSSTPPSASTPCRCQPHRTVAIAVPDPSPTPSCRAFTIAVPEVGAAPSSQSITGFHWLMVAVFWKMQGGSFFRGF